MSKLTATWVPNNRHESVTHSWLGGDQSNPTWDEYLNMFESDFYPVLEAVRACHEDNALDLYGEDVDRGCFLLSNGETLSMSMRAWGDFRQAIEGKREGYMRYYVRGW